MIALHQKTLSTHPSVRSSTVPATRFGAVIPQSAMEGFARQLPGMKQISVPRFLKTFDFKDIGMVTIPQMMLIYGLCLLSRSFNAARRSKNELREQVTRDSMGYAFWFFVTPILQRLFLKVCAPKQYAQALLELTPKPVADSLTNSTFKQKAQLLNWRFNPLKRFSLPSAKQVNEQMKLGLYKIKQASYSPESAEFAHIQNYYKNLVKWRNFATGLGIAVTVGLMGVGINLYNIHITRKKMARQQQEELQQAAQAPLPLTQPAPAFMSTAAPATGMTNPFG